MKPDKNPQKICECECHHEGAAIMHFMPCCDLTYKKYIIDGKVDNKIFAKFHEKPKKRKQRRK